MIAAVGGSDLLVPGPGNDTVDGGLGRDRIAFGTANTGVNVDLRAGQASGQGSDALVRVEEVEGTVFADVLIGDASRNRLIGGVGGDVLIGRRGADILDGGRGDDDLWGGIASDRLWSRGGEDLLVGGPGHDRLMGGAGDDRFGALDGFRDVVRGGEGVDRGRFDRRLDVVEDVETFL